ncbi:acetylserotonin O-methyltransferase [Medicago truncatula]|uniref:Flavonoid O-methyltransferase-like protein n=1 Tax=Medicago truncatula TaxID=3880 RepID=A0A072UT99_MEDTR|nr:acetylserotonin O-methyltransferase [Medicago truncatula]KEH29115.1 flavonoid O-methyltransferase-like protein [Medicago truncatula]
MEEIQSEVITWKKDENEKEEAEAQVEIWKYIFGFADQAVVKCAIELGIAEAIEKHGKPMSLLELSSTLGCNPSYLNRIMRFLIHRKIFKTISTNHENYPYYVQTPLSLTSSTTGDLKTNLRILHDWGDEECIQILKKCKEAIPNDNGRVIIVEAVIEEGGNHKYKDVGLVLDMVMMAHTNYGKERTLKEWEYVIKMAGFKGCTVKSINAVQCVILAFC